MPHHRSRRAHSRITRLRTAWLRERGQRPAAYRLALISVWALALSAALVAIDLGLIAQLVGGLAVLPLSLAAFLRLLPPPPWTDEGPDDRRQGRATDSGGPWPPDGRASEFNWDKFEQEFRAFVQHQALRSRQ